MNSITKKGTEPLQSHKIFKIILTNKSETVKPLTPTKVMILAKKILKLHL